MDQKIFEKRRIIPTVFIDRLFFMLLLCSVCGCYRGHLYVQQEKIDPSFLASSHVGTPDPLQNSSYAGERLLVGWNLSKELFRQALTLVTTVRMWDQSERTFFQCIRSRRGATSYFFPFSDKEQSLLTYRVELINQFDEVVEEWKHHFWVTRIVVAPPPLSDHRME